MTSPSTQQVGDGAPSPRGKAIVNRILFITSSPRGNASYSNKIGAQVLEQLHRAHPSASIMPRDLARDVLPHLEEDFAVAAAQPVDQRTPSQRAAVTRSDVLIDELLAADVIVIAVPMINFNIPSTLKTWVDHVTRRGRTFVYGEGGPKGLVVGKRVILVQAKGGVYSGPTQPFDFVGPYLKHMLGFLGMTDVTVIDVEGTALGPDAAEKAVARGMQCAEAVVGQMDAA
jgi:FMN-dependent NADH-azoreductase